VRVRRAAELPKFGDLGIAKFEPPQLAAQFDFTNAIRSQREAYNEPFVGLGVKLDKVIDLNVRTSEFSIKAHEVQTKIAAVLKQSGDENKRTGIPRAIAATRPVVFTRLVYAADGSDANVFTAKVPTLLELTEHAPASAVVDDLAPTAGEHVVKKTLPSAFFDTTAHA
jgi:hypothetical protein